MSVIDDIVQIMLHQGDIAAQEGRERIAAEEEQRQSKHRLLKNTLKGIAMFAPYFIPGGGIVPALGRMGAGAAGGYLSRDDQFLDPSQNPDLLVRRNY